MIVSSTVFFGMVNYKILLLSIPYRRLPRPRNEAGTRTRIARTYCTLLYAFFMSCHSLLLTPSCGALGEEEKNCERYNAQGSTVAYLGMVI